MLHPKTWKIIELRNGGKREARTGVTHEEAVLAILGAMHGERVAPPAASRQPLHEHSLAA